MPNMPMMTPPMGNGMMNGASSQTNMFSNMPEKMAGKILKDSTNTLSSLIQPMIQEGFQGLVQSGVPIADAASHVLSELLKMSQLNQGGNQASAEANQPNNQPPQVPIGKKEDQESIPSENTTPDVGTELIRNLLGSNTKQVLAGTPTAQETARRFILPEQRGGLFAQNRIGANGQFIAGGPFGSMFGIAPESYETMMRANAMNPANSAQTTAVEAAIKPITQTERVQQAVGTYTAQRQTMTEKLKDATAAEANALKDYNESLEYAGKKIGGVYFNQKIVEEARDRLKKAQEYKNQVREEYQNIGSISNRRSTVDKYSLQKTKSGTSWRKAS